MRRDYFTLTTRMPTGADDVDRPTLAIDFDGPAEELAESLTDDAGERLPADVVDVTCRRQSSAADECVVGLTHRLTGEFLLEVDGDATAVLDLVDAARSAADDDASYRVRVAVPDGDPYVLDKETLLVYDEDGNLERQHSLIPSGVEL